MTLSARVLLGLGLGILTGLSFGGTWRWPTSRVARGNPDMLEFLNAWLVLNRKDRTIERLFDYWFKGEQPPEIAKPRRSILHDALGRDRADPEAEGLP